MPLQKVLIYSYNQFVSLNNFKRQLQFGEKNFARHVISEFPLMSALLNTINKKCKFCNKYDSNLVLVFIEKYKSFANFRVISWCRGKIADTSKIILMLNICRITANNFAKFHHPNDPNDAEIKEWELKKSTRATEPLNSPVFVTMYKSYCGTRNTQLLSKMLHKLTDCLANRHTLEMERNMKKTNNIPNLSLSLHILRMQNQRNILALRFSKQLQGFRKLPIDRLQ